MTPERPTVERRILSALDAVPSRIPVVLGGCGSGRTSLLGRLSQLLGEGRSQYINAERAASTPESFLAAVLANSPYTSGDDPATAFGDRPNARAAFDALLRFLQQRGRPDAGPPTFLIDELLELRTFENFPGLRGVLREFLDTLSQSQNRFVLASRYVSRSHRLLRDLPERFEIIHLPPLSPAEVVTALRNHGVGRDEAERSDLGRMVHALADGRPAYVAGLAAALAETDGASGGDPVSTLASQLADGAPLNWACRFSYELRLHRARGYGALKAILLVLAEEEPLTLTEIAHRLGRTPGSTKDYLSWLEDVDLVSVRQKRYSYADPLMRLWVRLHCRTAAPNDDDLAREVQEYAVARLPYMEPAMALAESHATPGDQGVAEARKSWGMIEID